jgi:S-DNA-T family DNA segregation ATPase FtsK/SpoIIIE
MSILYSSSPEDVRLLMVDPKVVELSVYNGIPHLMIPVVTDPKLASNALGWAVGEMMGRYGKFANEGVKDIDSYNALMKERLKQHGKSSSKDLDGEPEPDCHKLPQIVIIIDELADLMMVASKEVESAIVRLAQLARAAGMHLVIATQRPSVKVITGLIKANVPSRIAFSVSSNMDSRIILDESGAENLLGKGDMLFRPSGGKLVRVQGAFVSEKEVSAVVEYLKGLDPVQEEVSADEIVGDNNSDTLKDDSIGKSAARNSGDERDDYFVEAAKLFIENDKDNVRASAGMLQRVYRIGFNRAARIMDQLAAAGVVESGGGTKPKKVLMTLEEFEELISN